MDATGNSLKESYYELAPWQRNGRDARPPGGSASGLLGHRRKFAGIKDQLNVDFDGYNTTLSA
ncbi:hypothetical protein N7530_001166 [Penicillium desertorum]|uniref:Uncharacterized protein n=1 Tax=Penicillium desertorum TaxID=1303715 RepID=A0A9W9XA79_9EURO|nr:hypothetical protein N7530_001166 [Penicillium desertorum]